MRYYYLLITIHCVKDIYILISNILRILILQTKNLLRKFAAKVKARTLAAVTPTNWFLIFQYAFSL